ncbi:MAG TPA: X-Pro dipeptidyl-peptidase-like protein [Lentisphaeria bacterium]|nr:MAG: hypothetical protein A2X45_04100 [Lentisphaerae bacterium GWF2_50_93]HCE46229.1 X-Pro dipeptidyl-peptidase-like protein [Lentisphaeria bacterium]
MKLKTIIFIIGLLLAQLPLFAQKEGREYEEAGKKNSKEAILKNFPEGSKHESTMLPMKDGTKLAVDVFIPPGKGPWPVIMAKGYYGHFSTSSYSAPCKGGEITFVCVDSRGKGNSEKGKMDPKSPDYEISDCNEIITWISRQSWCNGRIGTYGGSGNAVAAYCSFLAGNPAMVVVAPGNSSAYTYNYWGFNNGVRRASLYNWLNFIGIPKDEWPKPTLHSLDIPKWDDILEKASADNKTVVIASAGWYDIVSESAIELFMKCGDKARIFVSVGPASHAGELPFKFPRNESSQISMPKFDAVLLGKAKISEKSLISYFVMGDRNDSGKKGVGNVFKTSETWPPADSSPVPFYLNADGSLSKTKPTSKDATLKYQYDPRNPAPTIGGNWMYSKENMGPLDQSPLKNRKDILRFASEPLGEPVEIAGKVFAEIFFSTDVADTGFVVKLVDIYPDGYEMIIRESAGMARYAGGLDKPAPVVKGTVLKLRMDMWSTAIAFEKGHRIGFYVTSSSAQAYEVHPNTFEQVKSYEKSPVASQVIHVSAENASCVILPVCAAVQGNKD